MSASIKLNGFDLSHFFKIIITAAILGECLFPVYAKGDYPSIKGLSVLTFNTGNLKQFGIDVVPCVDERLPIQVREVEKALLSFQSRGRVGAALLQEVWTKEAFDGYRLIALNNGWDIYPKTYLEVEKSGIVNISTAKIIRSRKIEFFRDVSKRGILESTIVINGKTVKLANTHTEFSPQSGLTPNHSYQLYKINSYLRSVRGNEYVVLGGDFNIGSEELSSARSEREIWEEYVLNGAGHMMHLKGFTSDSTWSYSKNTLVSNPSKIIKVIYSENGGWEKFDANYDHIFSSAKFTPMHTSLIFNSPIYGVSCEDRDQIFLSDHFGVLTHLSL